MLAHSQRARLMRSARKVEALLGETPLCATASEPASIPGHHYTASFANSSLRGSGAARESNHPVLFLRLPIGASIASGTLPSPSPLSPTSGISFNSSSPATPSAAAMAAEEETGRRRNMAKLSRTFGEIVAPELVFSSASNAARIRRPGRASSLSNRSSRLRGLLDGAVPQGAVQFASGAGTPDVSSRLGGSPRQPRPGDVVKEQSGEWDVTGAVRATRIPLELRCMDLMNALSEPYHY
ncbi:hypothetical protein FB451DRAFT_1183159 [Mycena latifolia]|nr:hypothetical protein FB451DRAFT_1183159 [Mycena latifolia]